MNVTSADSIAPVVPDVEDKDQPDHIENEKHVDYSDAARAEDFQHSVSFKRSLVIHRVVCHFRLLCSTKAEIMSFLGCLVVLCRFTVNHHGRL
jgi:hypothetical protein